MDTMRLEIKLNKEITFKLIDYLDKKIYIKDLCIDKKDPTLIRFTFHAPLTLCENNAKLIETEDDFKKAKVKLENALFKFEDCGPKPISYKMTRVDIPFTYFMAEGQSFHSYRNIFYLWAKAYSLAYSNCGLKNIEETIERKKETYILADNKNTSKYNNKIQIYDQYKKFYDYFNDNQYVEKILKDYPDLKSRMRIEVSKKINRSLNYQQFYNLTLKEFWDSHLEYLKNSIFNKALMIDVIRDEARQLATFLEIEKKERHFSYENFIYKYLDNIHSYESLRNALEMNIDNRKTLENAVTTVKRILKKVEKEEDIIILEVSKYLEDISKNILNSIKKFKE